MYERNAKVSYTYDKWNLQSRQVTLINHHVILTLS